MKSIALFIALALVAAGCGPAGPAPLNETDKAAIQEATAAFGAAMRSADYDALAALYTEDALFLPPNHDAITGRAEIRTYLATFPPITRFDITVGAIEGAGNMAVVHGRYSMTLEPPGMPPMEDHGKYVEVRRRQPDGSWLIHWDTFNSSVPLPIPGS